MTRLFALLGLVLITACTNPNDLDETPAYLGNFSLGHNVVVAPNLTKGPASRAASKEEWIAAMTKAMTDRFSRYDGSKLYHLGVSVEGYVLAIPGVPLVASPKSALILNVTVWDDAAGKKLNENPHTVTVLESISGPVLLGSGLTQSKEKQMLNLSRNAAKQIQNWLQNQNNDLGWFEDDGKPAKSKARPKVAPTSDTAATAADEADEGSTAARTASAVAAAEVIEEPAVAPAAAE
ncbi:hypothetical protein SAMN04487859_120107 [Roseovarius lutimaris]|uniref:Uncharacterized protein n=1 Tax=Roseovarius lutimaris TaxID=1005928 RepID=A0A1I5FLZ1_9RHOB|nr:hypothetical protein [Roseovarius lutimaris]SFO24629.1 hypothetical protein SAMN04487859_120107 [Roseovarius lutimaris]